MTPNPALNRTACKLRLQVPSALRAPAAGQLYVGRRKMGPYLALARVPVPWPTALVRDRKHCHCAAQNLVEDCVGEVTKNMSPDRILVSGPHQRIDRKSINRLKRFGSKSRGRDWAPLEIPKGGPLISASASGRISTLKRVTERQAVLWLPPKKRP